MASGGGVPYTQDFWVLQSRPSLCKASSTHKVLLCTWPPKQKGSPSSTNHRSRPSAPLEFNPMDEPPPYQPHCQPSPSNSPTDSETSPDPSSTPLPHLPNSPSPLHSAPPPHNRVKYPTHVSPKTGGRTRGPHSSPRAIFIVRRSQIEEKLGSFSKNPTRYRKEFLRLSQAYNLT